MVDVQPEHGNFQIANQIADAFCRINLSAYEWRVVWAILRKTWGWQKKMDRISYTQYENLTGINRRHIARALDSLLARKIVKRSGKGYKLFYGLQKDFSKWESLPIQVTKSLPNGVTNQIVTYSGNTPLPNQVTNSLPNQVTTKNNKNTIQKTIPSNRDHLTGLIPLSLKYHQRQKSNGFYHQDFKQTLSEKSKIVLSGAETLGKLHRINGESTDDIRTVLDFVISDDFWSKQVVSLSSLRKKSKNGNLKYFNIKNSMASNKSKHKEPSINDFK